MIPAHALACLVAPEAEAALWMDWRFWFLMVALLIMGRWAVKLIVELASWLTLKGF